MDKNLARDIQLLSLTEMSVKEKVRYLKELYADFSEGQLESLVNKRFSASQIVDALKTPWCKFQGKRFEGYIVRQLKRRYALQHWSNDKHTQEVFDPKAKDPDLTFSAKDGAEGVFAIECKWHERKTDKVLITKSIKKLNHYMSFGERLDIPVFLAIGFGNNGDSPEEVCLIPLSQLRKDRITYTMTSLSAYRTTSVQDSITSFLQNKKPIP